ncbi:molybdate ABC transporter substrate-binding protein [Phyllobacterium sp. 628]|uniref:molybdate ABC transporter substrate-binding protein n=1 Tax=Phyllobacterium sp. 628 TaxID=2718938 RepID=UPI001662414B|nr:molybdate ABC transporter substrate-binding protein [Phyllobacterium sp. 628]QND53956.1 molybdate ABC transporter substrate-binding protein [Phyllobacterium sp. 628]
MKKILILGLVLLAALAGQSGAYAAEKITVFAAASMKEVIEAAAVKFEAKTGTKVTSSFAASSVLAKQIEQGAPANIFISADLDWMDYLEQRDLIDKPSRKIVAANALVILTKKDKGDAAAILGAGRFAMGDPSNVPAGKYGKAALESLKVWEGVSKNAVFTENVRAALEFVSRGEANAAIVYASDHTAAPDLVEAYRFAGSTHKPILYPAASVGKEASAEGKAFLEFLSSPEGQEIITSKGFVGASDKAG